MNRSSYGAGETDMEDVELAPPAPAPASSGEMLVDRDAANDGDDDDMEDDLDDMEVEAALFASAGEGESQVRTPGAVDGPPILWTRVVEGEESFLEISRR